MLSDGSTYFLYFQSELQVQKEVHKLIRSGNVTSISFMRIPRSKSFTTLISLLWPRSLTFSWNWMGKHFPIRRGTSRRKIIKFRYYDIIKKLSFLFSYYYIIMYFTIHNSIFIFHRRKSELYRRKAIIFDRWSVRELWNFSQTSFSLLPSLLCSHHHKHPIPASHNRRWRGIIVLTAGWTRYIYGNIAIEGDSTKSGGIKGWGKNLDESLP